MADTVFMLLRKMACKNDTDFDKSEGLHDDQWRGRTNIACKAVCILSFRFLLSIASSAIDHLVLWVAK